MTFKPEKVNEFLRIFRKSKKRIRDFPGCKHLELQVDYNEENIFATYSIWENEEALNNYRNSELFKSIWNQTRVLFDKNPIVFSSKLVEKVV